MLTFRRRDGGQYHLFMIFAVFVSCPLTIFIILFLLVSAHRLTSDRLTARLWFWCEISTLARSADCCCSCVCLSVCRNVRSPVSPSARPSRRTDRRPSQPGLHTKHRTLVTRTSAVQCSISGGLAAPADETWVPTVSRCTGWVKNVTPVTTSAFISACGRPLQMKIYPAVCHS